MNDNCGNNLNSNNSDKVNHRTHHTRFFEKLYGNLEKSTDEKSAIGNVKICNYQVKLPVEKIRPEIINSPSESSGSSTEFFSNDMNIARWNWWLIVQWSSEIIKYFSYRNPLFQSPNHDHGLNHFPGSILPSHFGSLRLPIGFTSDPHNHFAAFRKLNLISLRNLVENSWLEF